MSFHFRRAVTSEAKPLIGLYAESGGGKTRSALLLACGFVGGDMSKVGMIETEAGRGEAWADDPVIGGYNVLPIREEFSPTTYGKAISAAESAGFKALIVDSASHEWEGVGGVLAMAAKNQEEGKTGQLVWQKPKIDHSREFMLRLTQTPIPLVITCMRAKYPMEQVTAKTLESWDRPGRPPKVGDWIRSSVLEPKQSEDILYEMFVHGWLDRERHAFHGTKYTMDVLRQVFLDGEPITVETGQRLAAWAAARAIPAARRALPGCISVDQQQTLESECIKAGIPVANLLAKAEVAGVEHIGAADYQRALAWIARNKPMLDEAVALREIENAKDADAAQLILDRCRGAPFAAAANEAYRNRWEVRT